MPGKGGNSILGSMILIVFALFILFIVFIFNGREGNYYGVLIITFPILALGIYGLIYNLIIKKKNITDNFYCITNLRVLKYESKKDVLVYGFLSNYEDIKVQNVKDNYGDLYMGMLLVEEDLNNNNVSLKEMLLNPNKENMPCITFESIENPYDVLKMVKEARNNILKEKSK